MAVRTLPKKRTTKLERSHLDKRAVQNEAMGKSLDVSKFLIYFQSVIKFDAVARITSAKISRTIEGSSTLTVSILDHNRSLLQSGLLHDKLDVQIDGLWFRLVKVEKQDDQITLTFEDREVCILRGYKKIKIAQRSHTTRAEFILNLIREPKEYKGDPIPVVIPELHVAQPIQDSSQLPTYGDTVAGKQPGIPNLSVGSPPDQNKPASTNNQDPFGNPFDATKILTKGLKQPNKNQPLTVKGVTATNEQIENANIILQTGHSMGANRRVLVCGIMTAITESTLHNYPGGDRDSVGLFQQRASWGTFQERHDPATSARLFFQQCIPAEKLPTPQSYGQICQDVQRSAYPDRYELWHTEADRYVSAFGIPGNNTEDSAASVNNQQDMTTIGSGYFYYRGTPPTNNSKQWLAHESSWDAIQRMAEEVNWRAFMVSGVFYYMSDDDLLKSQPVMVIREFDIGVLGVDGDYDPGKKAANVTLTVSIGRWFAPPGSVVVLQNMGPWNGRWIVSSFDRDLLVDSTATISLKKKAATLPEQDQENFAPPSGWGKPVDPEPGTSDPAQFGGIEGTDGSRNAVVEVARKALQVRATNRWHYAEVRPMPDSLWSADAHTRGIDCSGFATLCYKEAGCPDPNNLNYNGQGYTGTLASHGIWVSSPAPGDLVFYRGTMAVPGHVVVYVGGGRVIGIGNDRESIIEQDMMTGQGSPPIGYKSYLPGGNLP